MAFRYGPTESWSLVGAQLTIDEGACIGIVGPSGTGKSTFIKLLNGILDPSLGTVFVGGVDVRSLGKKRLRELVSTVMQDDRLLAGTIFENISMFDRSASFDGVVEAAKAACVHDDIIGMPMKYETSIGDVDALMSGGQKQRICIARALYRKPKILLLDEATSSVDVQLERRILDNLSKLGVTRIIISHRPESLAGADRRYYLDKGRLIEMPAMDYGDERASSDE